MCLFYQVNNVVGWKYFYAVWSFILQVHSYFSLPSYITSLQWDLLRFRGIIQRTQVIECITQTPPLKVHITLNTCPKIKIAKPCTRHALHQQCNNLAKSSNFLSDCRFDASVLDIYVNKNTLFIHCFLEISFQGISLARNGRISQSI